MNPVRSFFIKAVLPLLFLAGSSVVSAPLQARRPGTSGLPQDENGFSVSPSLFATLAAINAAGYDAGIDSPLNEHYKVRTQVRQELSSRSIPSLAALKAFYKEHQKASATADLSQYISFAMIAKGPPDFAIPTGQVPPDVQSLTGFSELLARFYREANLEDLWARSQPAYTAAVGEYQDSVINALFDANGYLRNPSGNLGRRFQIYLDLLAAPDQIQVRSYQNDYFIIISPTTAPVVAEIRDAYLEYVLDPLSFKYKETIKSKKSLQKYAEEAPALDLAYKDDFSLLLTKSLIKALDARLTHTDAGKRSALINEAMREGFVLTAGFADLLPAYEKQQESFRIYYPDLITAIDVHKEEKRLKNVQFVQSVPARVIAPPAPLQIEPAKQTLLSAQGLYEQKNWEGARKQYRASLEQTTDKDVQGQALYGLALIDIQEKHWDEALNLFQRTAATSPNPQTTAWSHFYMGQLALAANDSEKAGAELKLVLATDGASPRARDEAEKLLKKIGGEQKP